MTKWEKIPGRSHPRLASPGTSPGWEKLTSRETKLVIGPLRKISKVLSAPGARR